MRRIGRRLGRMAWSRGIRRSVALALIFLALAAGQAGLARAGSGGTILYLPLVLNGSAQSATQKPPTDPSYYVTTPDPNVAYNLGCTQGRFDASASPATDSLVVLDFGGQLSDGSSTLLINGGPISNAQIEAVAEAFSQGYWYCTGSDQSSTLTLGIGTNNSYFDVNGSGGAAWAQVVAAVIASNQTKGYAAQVIAEGANDLEPAWDTTEDSEAWANGYAANAPAFYVDYGSADGCPTGNSSGAACGDGWTQYDVWYVSWGDSAARALPEIYGSVNAAQWAMLGLYGAENGGAAGKIAFSGPLDTYP
ncbi:MAG: hypothetical protein ACRDIY_13275, partial [Chloroflexota bacterium]